jgi:aryl-alcohol dehydrogenase-like predicted oxidoreductase
VRSRRPGRTGLEVSEIGFGSAPEGMELKAAQSLGITLPQSVLLQATEIIE